MRIYIIGSLSQLEEIKELYRLCVANGHEVARVEHQPAVPFSDVVRKCC